MNNVNDSKTEKFKVDVKNISKKSWKIDSFKCKNIIYFFISEYAWFLIILIIVLFGFLFPYYHPPQLFFSKIPKEPWNSDYTPKIFMHIADIHISFYLGFRTNGSTDYFEDFLDYKPDLILNSGDVVDNYEESYWPKVGSQWKVIGIFMPIL